MIIIWLICFITFYPGGGFYDTYLQINSPIYATTQHPLGYSFILYFFIVFLGNNILHSSIIGWAIYSIFQMIIVSTSISFAISYLIKKNAPPKFIVSILILIYALTPIYATYSIFATKDVLFSVLIIYLTILLFKIVETNGEIIKENKFKIIYILMGIALFQIRKNGNIVYIVITIMLIYRYRKYFSKIFYILLVVPIGINMILDNVISSRYGIEHYFQETIGVPIQQLSATVYSEGNLNEEELNYINKLLDIKIIKEKYNPETADKIKWNSEFNREYLQETKATFLKTWFTVMPKNFNTYVESYLLNTYYFWSINSKPNDSNMYIDTQSDIQADFIEEVKCRYNLYTKDILPKNVQEKLESFYSKFSNYLSEGVCFWLLMFICLILMHKKQAEYIFPLIPLIIIWITAMLATPINSSIRYMYSYVLLLPILLFYAITLKHSK